MYDPKVETASTILAKLGLSTLSGSNTGDETKASIIAKYGNFALAVVVVESTTDVASQTVHVPIPSKFNGLSLTRVEGFVITPGETGDTTIQVRNITKYASNDALSTPITIASTASKGTGTINTSYDDVVTDDIIKITVTGASTTAPKGLLVVLEYA